MLTDSISECPTDQTEEQASENNICYMQLNVDNSFLLYLMLTRIMQVAYDGKLSC